MNDPMSEYMAWLWLLPVFGLVSACVLLWLLGRDARWAAEDLARQLEEMAEDCHRVAISGANTQSARSCWRLARSRLESIARRYPDLIQNRDS